MCGKERADVAPLFAANAFEMLRERNECGRLADESVLQGIWREFCTMNAFVKKGSKVSFNRLVSLVKTGRIEQCIWAMSMRTVVYEYVCLEVDLLGGKKVGDVILLQQQQQHGEQEDLGGGAGARTVPKRPGLVDTALRRSTANAMACWLLTFSSPLAWRRLSIFVEFSDRIDKWHHEHSREARSCEATKEWSFKQVAGDWAVRHIGLFVGRCESSRRLVTPTVLVAKPGQHGADGVCSRGG